MNIELVFMIFVLSLGLAVPIILLNTLGKRGREIEKQKDKEAKTS